jgi:DNA-binding transcriptional regulator YiaG
MTNVKSDNGFVRKNEMAKIMGVSVRTIESWMSRRIIPYNKIDKLVSFDPEAVKEAIRSKYTVENL